MSAELSWELSVYHLYASCSCGCCFEDSTLVLLDVNYLLLRLFVGLHSVSVCTRDAVCQFVNCIMINKFNACFEQGVVLTTPPCLEWSGTSRQDARWGILQLSCLQNYNHSFTRDKSQLQLCCVVWRESNYGLIGSFFLVMNLVIAGSH